MNDLLQSLGYDPKANKNAAQYPAENPQNPLKDFKKHLAKVDKVAKEIKMESDAWQPEYTPTIYELMQELAGDENVMKVMASKVKKMFA